MAKKITERPQKQNKEQPKCSICYEKIARGSLECGHLFCLFCIRRWAKKKLTCPLCRKSFTKVSYGSRSLVFQQPEPVPKAGQARIIIRPFVVPWSCLFYWKPVYYMRPDYSYGQPFVQTNYF